ncbi:MAG: GerMN domain-containing protein [Candidatus Schekmanbacteria bacterium]|nr:GerMN domain-containing protein [Candidatus Schekmanbacteria bacterium]
MKNRVIIFVAIIICAGLLSCVKEEKKKPVKTEEAVAEKLLVDEELSIFIPSGGAIVPHKSLFQFLPEDGSEEKIKAVLARLLKGDVNFSTVFQSAGQSSGPGAAGIDVLDVIISRENIAYVDLSRSFMTRNPTGITSEIEAVNSVALTVLKNFPEITGVMILIDGKEQKTLAGHVDISMPFRLSDSDNSQGVQ